MWTAGQRIWLLLKYLHTVVFSLSICISPAVASSVGGRFVSLYQLDLFLGFHSIAEIWCATITCISKTRNTCHALIVLGKILSLAADDASTIAAGEVPEDNMPATTEPTLSRNASPFLLKVQDVETLAQSDGFNILREHLAENYTYELVSTEPSVEANTNCYVTQSLR